MDAERDVAEPAADGVGETLKLGDADSGGSTSLALTPQGHLRLVSDAESLPLAPELAERLAASFDRGAGHGLLHVGAREVGSALPPKPDTFSKS